MNETGKNILIMITKYIVPLNLMTKTALLIPFIYACMIVKSASFGQPDLGSPFRKLYTQNQMAIAV